MTGKRRITSRADLEDYVAAFNERDYARQTSYYAPDVRYSVGSITLNSPREIWDFYADFHDHSKEHVRIADFAMTGNSVAVAIPSRFEPFRDYEKNGLSFKAGEVRELTTLAFYRLKDGQIHRIRMARYGGGMTDFDE